MKALAYNIHEKAHNPLFPCIHPNLIAPVKLAMTFRLPKN